MNLGTWGLGDLGAWGLDFGTWELGGLGAWGGWVTKASCCLRALLLGGRLGGDSGLLFLEDLVEDLAEVLVRLVVMGLHSCESFTGLSASTRKGPCGPRRRTWRSPP
jgi:hypothetical protein